MSYLFGRDLIVAVNVSEFFYNCAINSPSIQETLFLRPSTKVRPHGYKIDRTRSDSHGEEVIMSTIGLTPSAGMLSDDTGQLAVPCDFVRLCPVLYSCSCEGPKRNRPQTMVAPYEDTDICEYDSLGFTVRPTDMGRIKMYVSDPPFSRAYISLCYRHVETSFGVMAAFTRTKGSPLTFDDIFEEAGSTSGDVWLEERNASMVPFPV